MRVLHGLDSQPVRLNLYVTHTDVLIFDARLSLSARLPRQDVSIYMQLRDYTSVHGITYSNSFRRPQ